MNVRMERITNSLKGVASMLATMSEVPMGNMIWNEWALNLLYKELAESIYELEGMVYREGDSKEENKDVY